MELYEFEKLLELLVKLEDYHNIDTSELQYEVNNLLDELNSDPIFNDSRN
jgi:DNA polymerase III delta subunit